MHSLDVMTRLQSLLMVICVAQAESQNYQQQFHDTQQQLSDLQEKHQRQTLELEAQLREQAAAAQQDKLQQVAAVKEQLERCDAEAALGLLCQYLAKRKVLCGFGAFCLQAAVSRPACPGTEQLCASHVGAY
jgi:hypothetical protein